MELTITLATICSPRINENKLFSRYNNNVKQCTTLSCEFIKIKIDIHFGRGLLNHSLLLNNIYLKQ